MKSTDLRSQQRLFGDCTTGLEDESDVQWDSPQETAEHFEPLSNSQVSNSLVKTELLPSSDQKTDVLPGFWTLPYVYPRVSSDRSERSLDEEVTEQNSWMRAIQEFQSTDGRQMAHSYQEPYNKMQQVVQDNMKLGDESYHRKDPTEGSLEPRTTSNVSKVPLDFQTQNNEPNIWPESSPTSTSNFQTSPNWAFHNATGNVPQINVRATKSYTELTSKQQTCKNVGTAATESSTILNLDNQKAELYSCEGGSNQLRGLYGNKLQHITPSDCPIWHTPQMSQLYSCIEQKYDINSFRATSSTNKKLPCCCSAHRQYVEFHNTSRIPKSLMRGGPNTLTTGNLAGTSTKDLKQRVPLFSNIPWGRSAVKTADRSSQDPQNFGLRTYEADSTSTQLSDNCSTSIQKTAEQNLPRTDGNYHYEQFKTREFPTNQGTRYGYVRKPYDIVTKQYSYRGSMPQASPTGSQIPIEGPSTSIELKRTYHHDLPQIPCDSQGCPTATRGDVLAENQRHPWLPAQRLSTPWISDAALEEKRRRNREASARCEEKRKWKTEQLKKDNQLVRLASIKLFEENQLLWERLERLRKRPSSGCGSGQHSSETEIN